MNTISTIQYMSEWLAKQEHESKPLVVPQLLSSHWNRSFYPTTSAVHPVSVLILHHREIRILWSQWERTPKNQWYSVHTLLVPYQDPIKTLPYLSIGFEWMWWIKSTRVNPWLYPSSTYPNSTLLIPHRYPINTLSINNRCRSKRSKTLLLLSSLGVRVNVV